MSSHSLGQVYVHLVFSTKNHLPSLANAALRGDLHGYMTGIFDWQDGYGAFSVSPQHEAGMIRYIENQEEHHRQETFADECSRLLGSCLQPQSPG